MKKSKATMLNERAMEEWNFKKLQLCLTPFVYYDRSLRHNVICWDDSATSIRRYHAKWGRQVLPRKVTTLRELSDIFDKQEKKVGKAQARMFAILNLF